MDSNSAQMEPWPRSLPPMLSEYLFGLYVNPGISETELSLVWIMSLL